MTARSDPPPGMGTLAVTILDPDDEPLATAHVDSGDGPVAALQELDDPSGLLAYIFGRGGRRITVVAGGRRLPAAIDTWWQGTGRAWSVRFDRRLDGAVGASAGSRPTRAPAAHEMPEPAGSPPRAARLAGSAV